MPATARLMEFGRRSPPLPRPIRRPPGPVVGLEPLRRVAGLEPLRRVAELEPRRRVAGLEPRRRVAELEPRRRVAGLRRGRLRPRALAIPIRLGIPPPRQQRLTRPRPQLVVARRAAPGAAAAPPAAAAPSARAERLPTRTKHFPQFQRVRSTTIIPRWSSWTFPFSSAVDPERDDLPNSPGTSCDPLGDPNGGDGAPQLGSRRPRWRAPRRLLHIGSGGMPLH
jgi:hypothetical protein